MARPLPTWEWNLNFELGQNLLDIPAKPNQVTFWVGVEYACGPGTTADRLGKLLAGRHSLGRSEVSPVPGELAPGRLLAAECHCRVTPWELANRLVLRLGVLRFVANLCTKSLHLSCVLFQCGTLSFSVAVALLEQEFGSVARARADSVISKREM